MTAKAADSPTTRRRRHGEAGFTLLEILVVVAILGLLITLVAPRVLRLLGGARVSVAGQAIQRLGSVLDIYKLDVGSYPSTDQGIAALLEKPGRGQQLERAVPAGQRSAGRSLESPVYLPRAVQQAGARLRPVFARAERHVRRPGQQRDDL